MRGVHRTHAGQAEQASDPSGSNTLLNYHYDYFASGQLQRVRDYTFSATPADTTYTYDNLDRLASAATANASPTWTMAWTYDDFGNRTSQTGTGSAASLTQTLTFDPATNRITSPSQYALYDANGNMGSSAAFDAFDRLIGNYYDAFGRRVAKPGPNNSNQIYFTDMSGRLLARYSFTCYDPNNNGLCYPVSAPTDTYQYFAGQRVGQLADRLGSTRNQTAGYDHYYPYGEKISGTSDDTFKYAQTYRDSDSGLDYVVSRYYVSGVGRFLTADNYDASGSPTTPQSWNRYSYVNGDPINYYDPSGRLLAYVGDCGENWISDASLSGPCDLSGWGYFAAMIGVAGSPYGGNTGNNGDNDPGPQNCGQLLVASGVLPTSVLGQELTSVLLGENSWNFIGTRQYQPGDDWSRSGGSGDLITKDTVWHEDNLMLDVIANMAAGGDIMKQLTNSKFRGLATGEGMFLDYQASAIGSSECNDLTQASQAVDAFILGGMQAGTNYNQWRASSKPHHVRPKNPGDLTVGNTDFYVAGPRISPPRRKRRR